MAEASIGVGITPGLKNTQAWKRSFSFLSPVLTGLGLAIVFGILTHTVTFDPTYNQVLIFLSGAAAAALVLRLLVQRERRTALQRVVSEIVGENVSPEVAAMRILEALCLSQGWDVALKWEVNAEENRLEFCSGWSAPRRKTETLIHNSTGINLVPGNDMLGRAWQQGRPVWVADLSQEPETSHTHSSRQPRPGRT
jgi:hypothetical protein